jgi:hypothetical protein
MPISFTCPHCGTSVSVSHEYAGQIGPCPYCQEMLTVPQVYPALDERSHPQEKRNTDAVHEPETKSNRLQFSLRTLLVGVTLCAVGVAIVTSLGVEFTLAFSGFAFSCVFVCLLVLALAPLDLISSRLPYSTNFILTPLLYCILAFAFFMFGEAIDQPHPIYAHGNWLTSGVANFIQFIPIFAVAALILVAIDAAVQRGRPRDSAYFPRFSTLWRGLSSIQIRLVLIVGVSLVLGYYAVSVIDVWSAQHSRAGLIWPPKRVFVTCCFLWGLLWLADCLPRPRRGTMAAAVGFLCLTFLLLLPLGFGVLGE